MGVGLATAERPFVRDQASYRSEEWAGGFQVRLLPRTCGSFPGPPHFASPKPARRELVRRASQVPPRVLSRVCIRARSSFRQLARPTICCGSAAKEHVAISHNLSFSRRKRVEHSAQNPLDFEPKSKEPPVFSVRSGEEDAGRQVPVVAPVGNGQPTEP